MALPFQPFKRGTVRTTATSTQQPLVPPFHYLEIGVSHTEGGGLSQTDRVGVSHTVFEAVEEGCGR